MKPADSSCGNSSFGKSVKPPVSPIIPYFVLLLASVEASNNLHNMSVIALFRLAMHVGCLGARVPVSAYLRRRGFRCPTQSGAATLCIGCRNSRLLNKRPHGPVLPSWAQLQKSSSSTLDSHIASYCKQIEQFRYNGFQQLVVAIHSYISMLPCARQSRRDGDGPTAGTAADNGDALTRAVTCGIVRPPMATPRPATAASGHGSGQGRLNSQSQGSQFFFYLPPTRKKNIMLNFVVWNGST